jgi:hypothetical protein
MSNEAKAYEAEGLRFEFNPNGSPFTGLLAATVEGHGTYTAEVNLAKAGSRAVYAKDAAELYGMDAAQLKRALNEICTLRTEEVAAAREAEQTHSHEVPNPEPLSPEAEALVSEPGVLGRYIEDVARIHGVVKDRNALRLQTLVAVGAQLAPLPNGKPAGANSILIGEAGRGKNHICDATTVGLPDDFYSPFESASAKSFYYRAENDPTVFKHKHIYPNEAEATDELIEMFRPLISGGKASHLTVNRTGEGRNTAQELSIEGPVSLTIPTVRNKVDTQLQTRMLVAELPDYEGRVAEHSRAVSRQLHRDRAGQDHTPKIRNWQAAFRSLTAIRHVVFEVKRDEFCFDSDTVSHGARLWGNLLGLALTNAWLEQRNREVVELANGERAIVATPEDYEAAYNIFKATCERSVVNLSDTHRKILTAVHELKKEDDLADGFSQRKIAEKAGVSVSTVSEHKTYLTKSVKLLREAEGGLTLIADAEPSWWEKGDLLVGFPRPEHVRAWWEEEHSVDASETTEHTEHSVGTAREPLGSAGNGVRQSTEQAANGAEQSTSGSQSAGGVRQETASVRQRSEHGTGLGMGETARDSEAFGAFGDLEGCIHGYPGGRGCYLCDPEHPERQGKQGGMA